MSDNSRISWTDATWSPVTGCTRVSEGCTRCYIERTPPFRMAGRRFTTACSACSGTGDTRSEAIGSTTGVELHTDRLGQPLRWHKPRRVFVCSMADLFHDDVPDEYIAQVWATMAISQRHTFQILTKRPARMRSLLTDVGFVEAVCRHAASLREGPGWHHSHVAEAAPGQWAGWPLPNVWLGVSAETQQWADARIPVLLGAPAAVRWVSAEPLLGPIDLRLTHYIDPDEINPATGRRNCGGCSDYPGIPHQPTCYREPGPHCDIDWVVAGGESGPGARPMDPEWTRDLRRQCAADGVPFFFKQYGTVAGRELGLTGAGSDPSEWPEAWPQEYPAVTTDA